MKIGVFDSGIGGLSVSKAIEQALPTAEVIFMHDTADHFPYATRSPEQIYGFILPIFQNLVDQQCDAIVVACNTVSTTLIKRLREVFSTLPLIAMEPMVKPAAEQTKHKIIAVCATPTTLASQRYQWLKDTYAQGVQVLELDCSDWSYLIENNKMDRQKIREQIEPVLESGADVVILGCTHYHWIEEEMKEITLDKAIVLQPEQPVIAELRRVLKLAA